MLKKIGEQYDKLPGIYKKQNSTVQVIWDFSVAALLMSPLLWFTPSDSCPDPQKQEVTKHQSAFDDEKQMAQQLLCNGVNPK